MVRRNTIHKIHVHVHKGGLTARKSPKPAHHAGLVRRGSAGRAKTAVKSRRAVAKRVR